MSWLRSPTFISAQREDICPYLLIERLSYLFCSARTFLLFMLWLLSLPYSLSSFVAGIYDLFRHFFQVLLCHSFWVATCQLLHFPTGVPSDSTLRFHFLCLLCFPVAPILRMGWDFSRLDHHLWKKAYSKNGLLPLQSHFFVTGLVFSLSKGSPLSSDSIKRNSQDCKWLLRGTLP
jgi:hypothetical protein